VLGFELPPSFKKKGERDGDKDSCITGHLSRDLIKTATIYTHFSFPDMVRQDTARKKTSEGCRWG